MSVNLSPVGGAAAQFFDNNGNPLSGGKLYTYAAGTTTPLAAYTTSTGNIPHTNPIILDSAGRVPGGQIWLTDGSVDYKFLLETSFSVLVGTFDNIPPAISGTAADIVYLPAGAGAVATTVQAKLRESVSVLDFIPAAEHAAILAGTSTYDATPAIKNAFLHKNVVIPAGVFRAVVTVATGSLTTLAGATVTGPGTIAGFNDAVVSATKVSIVILGVGASLIGVTITASNTNATHTDNSSLTVQDADPNATFNYNGNFIGIDQLSDSTVRNCTVSKLWRGVNASSVVNVVATGNRFLQNGIWGVQFYASTGVIFSNNILMYGGEGGGAAFSSSKKVVISGNYVKTSTTGINPGGSDAIGFNVEDVSITGNVVISRDGINLENGAVRYTVTGNTVMILKDYNLAGTNGVGISNTSDSVGGFSGLIGDGVISSNVITSYDGNPYAFGVKIGSVGATTVNFLNFIINNNAISSAIYGVYIAQGDVTKKVRNLKITGNIISATRGILAERVDIFSITDNTISISGSEIILQYDGIQLNDYTKGIIEGNSIAGAHSVFALSSPNVSSDVVIKSNIYLPHPITNVLPVNTVLSDANYTTTKWFIDSPYLNTSTNTALTLRGIYTIYSPASAVTMSGLDGFVAFKAGQMITVSFNGNVTLVQNPPYTYLKGGIAVTPPAGSFMQFTAPDNGTLQEVGRSF